jgi:CheY-like chemotaxis protein
LESDKWKVVQATSSKKALRILDQEKIDLILLDVHMPDVDGFGTAKKIRSQPHTQYIPIIFVTAIYKTRENQTKGYEAGVQDYLFKPFNIEIARAKVNALLFLSQLKKGLEDEHSMAGKFQDLIKHSNQPLVVLDKPTYRFEYVNVFFEELFGYHMDELKGAFLFKYLTNWEQRVAQTNMDSLGDDKTTVRTIKGDFKCADQSMQKIEWTIVEKDGKWLCMGKLIGVPVTQRNSLLQ